MKKPSEHQNNDIKHTKWQAVTFHEIFLATVKNEWIDRYKKKKQKSKTVKIRNAIGSYYLTQWQIQFNTDAFKIV